MYGKPVVDEEEGIAFRLPGAVNHILFLFNTKVRKVIDYFPGVLAVWNAEGEVEFVAFDAFRSEIMTFNHQKIWHCFVANRELHFEADGAQSQKIRPEMIFYEPRLRIISYLLLRRNVTENIFFGNVHKHDP